MSAPQVILCADWGKDLHKRAVFVADVSSRSVRRAAPRAWSLAAVLEEANRWTRSGPVLAAFDLPLSAPASYLAAAARVPSWRSPTTFVDFLPRACSTPHFFEPTSSPADWKVERPLFAVPPGAGGLTAYVEAAGKQRVDLLRTIDRKTRAKTMFATSGIPGTVGSSACDLWRELGPRLTTDREFVLWPFEGELAVILKSHPIVLGEIYPRAAYATALLDGPSSERPRLAVAKTKPDVRRAAMARLRQADWVRRYGVTIENSTEAEANEDDFDACVTAAALLRCVLEEQPLAPPGRASDQIEGGILGTGTINLDLPELTFGRSRRPVRNPRSRNQSGPAAPVRHEPGTFACPIPGCDKIFSGSRGGWDGHVGSVRIHPQWHPELGLPEARRRQFETDFPEFFRRQ